MTSYNGKLMTPSDEKFNQKVLFTISKSIRQFIPDQLSDNELRIFVLSISNVRNLAIHELTFPDTVAESEGITITIEVILERNLELGKNLTPPVSFNTTKMTLLHTCLEEAYRLAKMSTRAEIATQINELWYKTHSDVTQ